MTKAILCELSSVVEAHLLSCTCQAEEGTEQCVITQVVYWDTATQRAGVRYKGLSTASLIPAWYITQHAYSPSLTANSVDVYK